MASVDEINACVNHVAKKENLKNYTYELSGGSSLKTDGYLGDNTYLKVTGTTNTGDEVSIPLFIKSSINEKNFIKNTPAKEVFEREVFFYNNIFKAFDDLQVQRNIKHPFSNKPYFYGYVVHGNREHIILKNMKAAGFKVHNRKETMNWEHVKLIFRNYAKLHALSFALNDQKPNLFRELSKNYTDLLGKFNLQTNMMPNYLKTLNKVRNILRGKGDTIVLKKLESYERDIPYIITALCSEEKHDFVFLHGDCWNNNFMFKYEDESNKIPTEVCMIDWQLSKLGSPTVDLAHYLYACASKEQFDRLDELLDLYYDVFYDFLRQLGSDPNVLFPKHRLIRHYKKYAKYGITTMFILLHISLVEEDETPDLVTAAETGDFSGTFCGDIREQPKLDIRAREALIHAVEKEFL